MWLVLFQATIGGKFAPLIGLSDGDMDMVTIITTYNTAVTDAASEILRKEHRRKRPLVTKDVLDLCDERRDLKKKRYEAEGAKEYMYREANRRIQKAVKKAKEAWIGAQCEEIETCLNKNNSKRAYQLVKDLTSEKQGMSSTIHLFIFTFIYLSFYLFLFNSYLSIYFYYLLLLLYSLETVSPQKYT